MRVNTWIALIGAAMSLAVAQPGPAIAQDAAPVCQYTNDGQCDEPDGCAPGTDVADCRDEVANSCEYARDGECDELDDN